MFLACLDALKIQLTRGERLAQNISREVALKMKRQKSKAMHLKENDELKLSKGKRQGWARKA